MCDGCGCGGEQAFDKEIAEVIESIRPMLKNDGGDIELVGVDDDKTVRVRLQGACKGCPGAAMMMTSEVLLPVK